jgi:UPF0176 protein
LTEPEANIVVAALYKFTPIEDPQALKPVVLKACIDAGILGTLLLAREGINGTVAGSREGIDTMLAFLRNLDGLADLEHKESFAAENPFYRVKVRLKKEIVTMGVPGIDPNEQVGTYVAPQDWNDLISRDDVVLIDTRNDYEVEIGTFEGAVNPHITTFREFPEWYREHGGAFGKPKVAMFCTGGIRCEKATALLKAEGIEDVFHLQGGILKYLETIPEQDSKWQGECFVFDQRVAVGHGLEPGNVAMCHACRWPLTEADMQADTYVHGVSCPHCHAARSDTQRQRYRARQQQIERAEARGEQHIGGQPTRAGEDAA